MSILAGKDVNNWLGRSQFAGDTMLDGQLYDLRIYNGIMTASEVAARYIEATYFGPTVIPQIQSFNASTGTLIWDSEPGATYHIMGKASLTSPSWTTIDTIMGSGPSTTGTVSTAALTGIFKIEAE